jgi:hypothetical protein
MGPFFGFPPLKISRPLHKIIRVERVEAIRQLVRKAVNQFSPLDSSDNHTGTDGYLYLALQLTFFNGMLTLSDFRG